MQHHEARVRLGGDMFRAMHAADCPLEQARLSLVQVRTMFDSMPLHISSDKR